MKTTTSSLLVVTLAVMLSVSAAVLYLLMAPFPQANGQAPSREGPRDEWLAPRAPAVPRSGLEAPATPSLQETTPPEAKSQAGPVTYYVATSGNDANSCQTATNTATPRRTIAAGIACVQAGDTLYIRGGTYNESIDSNAYRIPSGSSWNDAPLIAGYANETVSLNTLGIAAPSNAGQSVISYVRFDNLHMVTPCSSCAAVGIWGAVHHVRVSHFEAANAPSADGIDVFVGRGGGGQNELLYGNVHDNKGCFAEPCASGTTAHGLYVEQSNNVFDHLEVHHNGQHGMQIYRSSGTQPSGNIVRNSVFHDNMQTYRNSGSGLTMSGNNNLAYNNLFYGSADKGLAISNNGPTNNSVYNNTFYNNAGAGIAIQEGSGHLVKNNILDHNGQNIVNTASNTTFANNLCGVAGTGCTTVGNPAFIDPTATPPNFHLAADSAALNVGVTLSAVATDFDGTARPQGSAYDAGAYETGGTAPPQPEPQPPPVLAACEVRSFCVQGTDPCQCDVAGARTVPLN